HHFLDPFFQPDARAGGDVGGLVRPQGQHPAPFVAFGLPRLGDFLGVRFVVVALFDRARALYFHVRFLDPDFGVAVFDPLFRVRQVFGRVEPLGGRITDVDDFAAGRLLRVGRLRFGQRHRAFSPRGDRFLDPDL